MTCIWAAWPWISDCLQREWGLHLTSPSRKWPMSVCLWWRGRGRWWLTPTEPSSRSIATSGNEKGRADPVDRRLPKRIHPCSPQVFSTFWALPGSQKNSDPFLSYRPECYHGQDEDIGAQSHEGICSRWHSWGVAELGQQSKVARAF